jgi:arylsulfatase
MVTLGIGLPDPAPAQESKPNILILWGDDIGNFNISAYNQGLMGYKTPNIDSIAKEGALFTDWYGQQSCTAGRGAFVTGQSPIRTGLNKVGLPGAPEGMKTEDPTIAGLLKPLGYVTGQFGKNHLGDRDEMLPTNNGFDEFFGNLYHLNAEEEPENLDYPRSPQFKKNFGPRGVIHSWANADGTQRVEDTGPLKQGTHGDGRRGNHGSGTELYGGCAPGGQAVLCLVELDQDAHFYPPEAFLGGKNRSRYLCRRHG